MTPIRDRILKTTSRKDYRPLKAHSLLKRLRVPKHQAAEFWDHLQNLMDSGELREDRQGRIQRHRKSKPALVGFVQRKGSGRGVIIPQSVDSVRPGQEIVVDRDAMSTACSGDKVRYELLSRRLSGGARTARVVEVLERSTHRFIGLCQFKSARRAEVTVSGRMFSNPFYVADAQSAGAADGDHVLIEIVRFPRWGESGEAVIVEVVDEQQRDLDIETVRHEFGLPGEFPEAVLKQVREAAERFDPDDRTGRLDLTDAVILTIDPVDARDFDDAISLDQDADGSWHLGVHIADVGHFIPPGSRIDSEAQARGTSVYLPRHVIPMVPPILSNGLASLQEGQVRLTKSVFIDYSAEGEFERAEFRHSVICVTQRFTYEQVSVQLGLAAGTPLVLDEKVEQQLRLMHQLSRILRRRRMQAGTLQMDLAEKRLAFDDDGKVVGAVTVHSDESHELIEEFMLAANTAVATEFARRKLAFLRRNHAPPTSKRIKDFQQFVEALGFQTGDLADRQHVLKLLQQVRGTPMEQSVNLGLLKSLKQADYSPEEIGHFALNFEHYCHFTSPIRRYPDLTVHRLFDQLTKTGRRQAKSAPVEKLQDLGRQCSRLERRAEKAEREVVRIKLLRLMEPRVGEEWETVVRGIERFGVFCEGVDIPADGLLPIEMMNDDIYDFDLEQWCIVGRRSGRQLRIGTQLTVVIDAVDIQRRELRLKLPGRHRPVESRHSRGNGNRKKSRGKRSVGRKRRRS